MNYLKVLVSRSKDTVFSPRDGIHSLFDDLQGMMTGLVFMSLGVILFKSAHVFTGGVTGLALTVYYWSDIHLGIALTLLNLPFYLLSFYKMGKAFTLKSIISVSLLSLIVSIIPEYLVISSINPYFAAICGGLLIGVGLIQMFRHRASVGGFNVLVIFLQQRKGWNAGLVQMMLDFCVISLSVFSSSADIVIASFLGAFALNFTISVNHRPGRYISF